MRDVSTSEMVAKAIFAFAAVIIVLQAFHIKADRDRLVDQVEALQSVCRPGEAAE